MPLAKDTTSGKMPYCWKAKRLPVRPYAGLDLVHQQQPVLLRAQSGNGLHIVTVQGQHAALALDQLHHDGAHVVPRRGLQGGKVVGRRHTGTPR